jgi:hypothetical protein
MARSSTKKIRITMSLFHTGDIATWLIDSRVPYLVKYSHMKKWAKSSRAIRLIVNMSSGNPTSRTNSKGVERPIKIDIMLRSINIPDVRDNLMLLNIKNNTRYRIGRYTKPVVRK